MYYSKYKEAMFDIINNQTEKLFWQMKLKPNFELEKVVEILGGKCVFDEAVKLTEAVISNNGMYLFEVKCGFNLVDIQHPNNRFALAYEIGRVLLHMSYIDKGQLMMANTWQNPCLCADPNLQKWEAEEFAAAFLMPRDEFIMDYCKLAVQKDIDICQELAKRYGVLYPMAISRMMILKI